MKKKKQGLYTLQEVDELKAWFDAQTLPPTMQVDSSAFSPNLEKTVNMLFEQAYVCHERPRMQGCFLILEKIKKNLEAMKASESQE